MTIKLDYTLDELKALKVLIDIMYDSYLGQGGAKSEHFKTALDKLNTETDREMKELQGNE